ncbi:MAG TPA: hypothetical protein VEL76_31180 [Gemmataceae bacterium]|nr:hypothetical protein [Gemmataceae bacterium]
MSAPTPIKLPGRIVRILLLVLPVLLVFAGTVLLSALALSWIRDVPLGARDNLLLGIICGLIVWLFLAIFHIRKETIQLPVSDPATFWGNLVPLLEELGYEVKSPGAGRLVSWPAFGSFLVGGRLQVEVADGTAQVTGPKMFVEILRSRLRLLSYIARAQQGGRDARCPGGRLLKRVAIRVRVDGLEGLAVHEEIVQALVDEGAEVLAELHLFAQSEEGIREETVDLEIRERLKQRGLTVEVRKDHPRWDEPAGLSDVPVDVTPVPPRVSNLLNKRRRPPDGA